MFTKIPTCCIKGCDSYKYNGTQNLAYFDFPLHNEILLKKWLKQLGAPNWRPIRHQICTMHFAETDMDHHPDRIQPFLKPTSIPTIFPTNNGTTKNSNVAKRITILSNAKIIYVGKDENFNMPIINSKSTILIPAKNIAHAQSQTCDLNFNKPEVFSKLPEPPQSSTLQRKFKKLPQLDVSPEPVSKPDILIITKHKNISNGKSLLSRYPGNKRPVLRITISKRYKDAPSETSGASVETMMEQISKNNETNCAERVTEAENDSVDNDNFPRKMITIENSRTNRTVTYELDPITGELVVTTNEIDGSSDGQERARSARTKQKSRSPIIRKTEPVIRKRSSRIRRAKDDPEFIATIRQTRKARNPKALTPLESHR